MKDGLKAWGCVEIIGAWSAGTLDLEYSVDYFNSSDDATYLFFFTLTSRFNLITRFFQSSIIVFNLFKSSRGH
jgi:hypothetical protein